MAEYDVHEAVLVPTRAEQLEQRVAELEREVDALRIEVGMHLGIPLPRPRAARPAAQEGRDGE